MSAAVKVEAFIEIGGESVPIADVPAAYVCAHCGGDLDHILNEETNALLCKGTKSSATRHWVKSEADLAPRPPEEATPRPRKKSTLPTMRVGGLERSCTFITNRYICARCGALLAADLQSGKLRCTGEHRHIIESERDLKPMYFPRAQREKHDLEDFRDAWEQTTGGSPMPIKDRKRRATGLSRAGVIRLGVKVPVIDKDTGKQKKWSNGQDAFRPVDVDYFVLTDAPAVAEAYEGFKPEADEHGKGPTELLEAPLRVLVLPAFNRGAMVGELAAPPALVDTVEGEWTVLREVDHDAGW